MIYTRNHGGPYDFHMKPSKPRNYYQKPNCIFNAALHGKSINLKTELGGDKDRFEIEHDGKTFTFAMCAPNPNCGEKGANNFCMKTDGNYTNLGKFQFVRYVDQTFTMVYNKGAQDGFQKCLNVICEDEFYFRWLKIALST